MSRILFRAASALCAIGATGSIVARAQFEKPISVTFDGWSRLPDSSYELVFGYVNRNSEPVEIAIGSDNVLSPGPQDGGQPTVFLPGRQRLVFRIPVGSDFAGKYVWTVSYGGTTQTANASLDQNYSLDVGDEPPPRIELPHSLPASGAQATMLQPTVAAAPPRVLQPSETGGSRKRPELDRIVVWWSKYRGPGAVTFGDGAPQVVNEAPVFFRESPQGTFRVVCSLPLTARCGSTTARFAVPGTYMLRVVATERTSSSAVMTVTVRP
jgi:hypothetical protein